MTKIVQHSFLGGQLDWEMMGRQDVEKYRSGASLLRNVVLHKRGAAFKRPGTDYVGNVTEKISNNCYRLVPFASTTTQGWALLFTSGAIYAVNAEIATSGLNVVAPLGFQSYTSDELKELDYCQCGDIVYIAHQKHPPCMIRHTATTSGATTTHAFTLTVIDLAKQSQGIPSITGATVSKTGISNKGPSYTEVYKVTAVYDGVETYPSASYSNSNCKDYDSNYADVQQWNAVLNANPNLTTDFGIQPKTYIPPTKTYSGTAYTLPWTESQKISLKISVPSRGDGERPEQVRIYRKTGSFYGLVGLVHTSGGWTEPNTKNTVSQSTSYTRINYNTSSSKNNAMNATKLDCETFGLGVDGFNVNGSITLTLDSAAMKATVDMKLGHISYSQSDTSGLFPEYDAETTYNIGDTCTYNFKSYVCNNDGTTGEWNSDNWNRTHGPFEQYDSGYTYDTGDTCTYNGKRYVCKCDGTTGPWDSDDWKRSTVTKLLSRTYTYRPCKATSFKVQLGSGTEKSVSVNTSNENKTKTITQSGSESKSAFESRAESEASAWAQTIDDDASMSVEVRSDAASTSVTITPQGTSEFVMYNVTTSASTTETLPQSLTWEDKYYTPDVSVTPPSETEVMSAAGEYPGCVCLSQQRLIWASTKNDPSRVFMSEVGAFYTYSPHDVQVADDPIDFQVSATQFPRVYHMAELRKIILFNGGDEWIVDSASANSGITFETIRATRHSCIGSSTTLKPVVCNNVLLFAERTGQAVRQYGYELEDDGYGGNDISIFAQSIFNEKKIVAWAYQQHPHSTCWCVLSDGTLASLTFNREQQCIAWATHVLGGGGQALDIVCTQAVIGNDANLRDTSEILLLVKRGGSYFIERMRPEAKDQTDTPSHFVCMDSVQTIFSGATRRSGTTLVDLATMQVVTSASASGSYAEGYAFDTRITTAYPVVADAVGMAQMDVKCVQYANLRLMRSVGGKVKNVGTLDQTATPLVKTTASNNGDGTFSIFPVDERVLLPASESRDGRIEIFSDSPLPFGVTMIETDLDTEENQR